MLKVPVKRYLTTETEDFARTIAGLGGFIAGGFARHLSGHGPSGYSDMDIYARDKRSYQNIHAYFNQNPGIIYVSKRPAYDTTVENYTFRNNQGIAKHRKAINLQLVGILGSPEEVTEDFDFTVCQVTYNGACCQITPQAIEDNKKMMLVWTGKRRQQVPLQSTAWRVSKYLDKGYHIQRNTLMKMMASEADPGEQITFFYALHAFQHEELDKYSWYKPLRGYVTLLEQEAGWV